MSKAEAFEVNFGENKSIGVNVNFSKGDAIQVPVSINSLDAEKVADRIADQLQLPEIDTTELAKQGENQEATNSAILSALNGVAASMYKGVPIVSQTGDATIAPNVLNVWGEVTSLNITKGNDIDGITNLYIIRFVAGENLQVSFTGFDLLWYGGSVPTWRASSTYEINIVDNLALWAEFTPA